MKNKENFKNFFMVIIAGIAGIYLIVDFIRSGFSFLKFLRYKAGTEDFFILIIVIIGVLFFTKGVSFP